MRNFSLCECISIWESFAILTILLFSFILLSCLFDIYVQVSIQKHLYNLQLEE